MGSISPQRPSECTITILGCGALGTAILSGLLESKPSPNSPTAFTNFIACVRREDAAKHITSTLLARQSSLSNIQVLTCENLHGIQRADIIILACQPHLYREALSEPGISQALSDKLLISVLAGVSEADIQSVLGNTCCHIIRAMPNTASEVRDSMTVIPLPSSTIPQHLIDIADYIFSCVGTVRHIDPALMNACTTLCGSSPAFFAVIVDALVNSAVSLGVKRADAVVMAAQAMRGTASLILEGGVSPTEVRDGVTSPGGSTIVGVLKMEEGGVRSALDRALVGATEKAEMLGKRMEA